MKKRVFAIFLTVAMLLSLAVAPVYANVPVAEVTDPDATTCGCGCGKKFAQISWKEWTGEVSSGHFYLSENYVAKAAVINSDGTSFCYYYVEELHAMAKTAGINMRVCNLYYSGCSLYQHYTRWVDCKSNYQYYETYTDGREGTNNTSLEWGLAQQEEFVQQLQSYAHQAVEDMKAADGN